MNELIQLAKLLRDAGTVFSYITHEEFNTCDMTWQQVLILEQIIDGPKTMADLNKALNLSYSTTSGLVSRLERQNVVKRVRDKKDGRVVWITLIKRPDDNVHSPIEGWDSGAYEGLVKQMRQTLRTLQEMTAVKQQATAAELREVKRVECI
ncbi:MarR family winged helix-turn-helix transcriptional regulator [Brevibacillus dissolubilis]|uniref:MarR family winged helix-turn-helix transcriptional regulator n=1 Tax=Brevibacillus dissolubilis TaxID=1844116 RepID=UPI0011160438|nr:MarR family transcriptional regulator [Brevibacillus dissolubilis]